MKQEHSVSYFVGYTVLALDYHRETRSVYVTVSAKTQLSEVYLHNDVGYIHTLRDWEYIDEYQNTGGRLNKKDGLTRYGNSHVKDKTS